MISKLSLTFYLPPPFWWAYNKGERVMGVPLLRGCNSVVVTKKVTKLHPVLFFQTLPIVCSSFCVCFLVFFNIFYLNRPGLKQVYWMSCFSDVVTLLALWRVLDLYTDAGPPEPESRACWWQVIARNTDLDSIYDFTDLNVFLHSHFQHWFSLAVSWTPNTLVFISISTFIGSRLNSQALPALIDLPAIQLCSSVELQLFMWHFLWQQLNSQTQYWIQEQMAAKKVLQERAVQIMKMGYAYSFQLNKKRPFREWKQAMPTRFDRTRKGSSENDNGLCWLLFTEQELLTREKNRVFMCQQKKLQFVDIWTYIYILKELSFAG